MFYINDGRFYLPSRNRPKSLARFFEAYHATGAIAPGAVVINMDDWLVNQSVYANLYLPANWEIALAEADSMCGAMRFCWPSMKELAWVGWVDDDYLPETPGWDVKMVGALNGHNFVSTNDCWQAKSDVHVGRMCGAWAFSGDLLRTVGYLVPDGFKKSYVDDVWETIGKATGTWTPRMDILIRHLHPMKTGGDDDETNAQVGKHWISDTQTFRRWKVGSALSAIARVKGLLPKHDDRAIEADARAIYASIWVGRPEAWESVSGSIRQYCIEAATDRKIDEARAQV